MMKKKQVVRRMGGGAMKKQVVKKRGGGAMKPTAMNKGGTANAPGGLIGQHKRMAMGLMPMVGAVGSRKLKRMKGKKQTRNDRLDERLGMKDGKESTKSQSMKSRRNESTAMKRGGGVSPGKLKAMTGETTKRKALRKLAKRIKPTGRINTDDLDRARKMMSNKK